MRIQIAHTGISAIFLEHLTASKMKLLGPHDCDAQLTKRQHLPAITAINTAATTLLTYLLKTRQAVQSNSASRSCSTKCFHWILSCEWSKKLKPRLVPLVTILSESPKRLDILSDDVMPTFHLATCFFLA
jgi:hypothetical protein